MVKTHVKLLRWQRWLKRMGIGGTDRPGAALEQLLGVLCVESVSWESPLLLADIGECDVCAGAGENPAEGNSVSSLAVRHRKRWSAHDFSFSAARVGLGAGSVWKLCLKIRYEDAWDLVSAQALSLMVTISSANAESAGLRILREVAAQKSYLAPLEALSYTQSAVSQAVATLRVRGPAPRCSSAIARGAADRGRAALISTPTASSPGWSRPRPTSRRSPAAAAAAANGVVPTAGATADAARDRPLQRRHPDRRAQSRRGRAWGDRTASARGRVRPWQRQASVSNEVVAWTAGPASPLSTPRNSTAARGRTRRAQTRCDRLGLVLGETELDVGWAALKRAIRASASRRVGKTHSHRPAAAADRRDVGLADSSGEDAVGVPDQRGAGLVGRHPLAIALEQRGADLDSSVATPARRPTGYRTALQRPPRTIPVRPPHARSSGAADSA